MTREQKVLRIVRRRLFDDFDTFLDNVGNPLPNLPMPQLVPLIDDEWERVMARRYLRLLAMIDSVLEAA